MTRIAVLLAVLAVFVDLAAAATVEQLFDLTLQCVLNGKALACNEVVRLGSKDRNNNIRILAARLSGLASPEPQQTAHPSSPTVIGPDLDPMVPDSSSFATTIAGMDVPGGGVRNAAANQSQRDKGPSHEVGLLAEMKKIAADNADPKVRAAATESVRAIEFSLDAKQRQRELAEESAVHHILVDLGPKYDQPGTNQHDLAVEGEIAVSMLTDQGRLATVASGSSIMPVALLATNKLTDQAQLLKLVVQGRRASIFGWVWQEALLRLVDPALLNQAAPFLTRIALAGNEQSSTRLLAALKLPTQAALETLVMTHLGVRWGEPGQDLYRDEWSYKDHLLAVRALHNQELLEQIVVESSDGSLLCGQHAAAVSALTSQTALTRLADDTKWDLKDRRRALPRLRLMLLDPQTAMIPTTLGKKMSELQFDLGCGEFTWQRRFVGIGAINPLAPGGGRAVTVSLPLAALGDVSWKPEFIESNFEPRREPDVNLEDFWRRLTDATRPILSPGDIAKSSWPEMARAAVALPKRK